MNEAMHIFEKMQQKGVRPHTITCNVLSDGRWEFISMSGI